MYKSNRIDLQRLLKVVGEKKVTFVLSDDGTPLDDEKARRCLAAYIADGFPVIPMSRDVPSKPDKGKEHTRLARLKAILAELKQKQMDDWRRTGGLYTDPKLLTKIQAAEAEIKESEAYLPRKLSEIMPTATAERNRLLVSLLKTHVAADYLAECANIARDELKRVQLGDCNLMPLLRDIERKASDYAAIVCHPEFAGLSAFMTTNAKLLDGIGAVVGAYITNSGLNINDL